MPLLTIQTNIQLENARLLAETASATVAGMLGKPESYVMVQVNPEQQLMFAGSHKPCALLELKSLGLNEQSTSAYSEQLCELIHQQCNIPTSRIYIEFSSPQRHLWGWDNKTF